MEVDTDSNSGLTAYTYDPLSRVTAITTAEGIVRYALQYQTIEPAINICKSNLEQLFLNRRRKKMKYTELMSVLSEANKDNQTIIIYFENGLVFKSCRNTGAFESSNCLEMDDKEYLEYYACGVEITEILNLPQDGSQGTLEIECGKLLEVSELNEPIRIEAEGKGIIWQK